MGADNAPPRTFQSTLPVRGATGLPNQLLARSIISIHAPREGSDGQVDPTAPPEVHFNPRSP